MRPVLAWSRYAKRSNALLWPWGTTTSAGDEARGTEWSHRPALWLPIQAGRYDARGIPVGFPYGLTVKVCAATVPSARIQAMVGTVRFTSKTMAELMFPVSVSTLCPRLM